MDPAASASDRTGARTEETRGKPRCQRCGLEMEEGYLLDRFTPFGRMPAVRWFAGAAPARMPLFGRRPAGKQRTVASFRCSRCGLLESYAL